MADLVSRREMLGTIAAALGVMSLTQRDRAAARDATFFDRTRLPIGIQLYTLAAEAAKDLDGTLSALSARFEGLTYRKPF